MTIHTATLERAYREAYSTDPALIVRAPGRVNIIGEHTDYNHGFVLPMAIERETVIAARKRDDLVLRATALNLDRSVEVDLRERHRHASEPWIDYIIGVAEELAKLGKPLSGADILIQGDVPIGCGLSSSASLEMAALVLFEQLGGFTMEGADAPRLGQRVENDFLGLSSGIMDQFISRMGKAGHALFLDCRSYEYELVPVAFPDAVFVIANTGVSRGLTASKYNERVAECVQAVTAIRQKTGSQGTHLRDFTLADLDAARESLPETVYLRARHVITENDRTVEACAAMRRGDAAALGRLMDASHESLRHDYEVTCPELDSMVAIARQLGGCHGARMTGAGFGGCTVNLVKKGLAEAFGDQLMEEYNRQMGLRGEVIASEPAEGASVVK
jgi:galactokinase